MKHKRISVLLTVACMLHAAYAGSQTIYGSHILVVGGGGARGAWGGGFAQYLRQKYSAAYPVVFGTSTGSLMAPLIVLDDYRHLREAYTTVSQRDIFDHNPFNEQTGELRWLNAIWRILTGKETFGCSNNLRSLMDKFLKQADYDRIIQDPRGLQFTVTATNMATGKPKYISSSNIKNVEVMKDWMWASANEPLFMSYVRKNDSVYVDGGVVDNVPVTAALDYALRHENITDIDVIINKPVQPLMQQPFNSKRIGILKGLQRLTDIWTLQVRDDNILIALLQAYAAGCERETMTALSKNLSPSDFAKRVIRIHPYYFPTAR